MKFDTLFSKKVQAGRAQDLGWAEHLAQRGAYYLACFLAQQVAEKALQASLCGQRWRSFSAIRWSGSAGRQPGVAPVTSFLVRGEGCIATPLLPQAGVLPGYDNCTQRPSNLLTRREVANIVFVSRLWPGPPSEEFFRCYRR